MILPTMTTLSVDGLRAVPDGYRQGSLALGYTRWQTIWHVVLKSAMPSLMTAVILGHDPRLWRDARRAHGHRRHRGHADVAAVAGFDHHHHAHHVHGRSTPRGSAQDDVLWALGLLLMGMSLIFILIIHLIGRKGAKARG